jgi:hypothetical protein
MRRLYAYLIGVLAILAVLTFAILDRGFYHVRPHGPMYLCPGTGQEVFYSRDCR